MSVRIDTLANGLRVVSDTMDRVETVSLGVWVGVGTRDEPAELNGIAHLLEHMAFKGTRRRSALEIAEQIESVGGHLNAYTSRETTAYYAKVLKDDTALALDILADILQHSVFAEAELTRERDVVLQEIGQANDTPDDVVFDQFQWAAYPDQPLGRPVLGSAEIVGTLPRKKIADYMRTKYKAPNMVLAAAGNLDHDELVKQAEELFAELPAGDSERRAPARYRGGDACEARELEQVHLLLGLPGLAFDDPDYYAMGVFSTLLGGGMSSRLFQEVREKRGLAYAVYSFASSYRDGGLFGVYAGTGEGQAAETARLICGEITDLAGRVGADELNRARTQIKAGLLMGLESNDARCERVAGQMLVFGRAIPVAETIERIEAVDETAITRVARRLVDGKLTYAALGPTGGLETYEAVAKRLN